MICKLKLLILLLLIQFSLFGQTGGLKRGDKAFANEKYAKAIVHFKSVKEKNPVVNRKIAESYFKLENYNEAEKYYNKIYESVKTARDLINLSQINLANDNIAAAVLFAERAGELGADPGEVQSRLDAVRKLTEIRNSHQDSKIVPVEIQPKGKCLGLGLLPEGIVFSEAGTGEIKSKKNYRLFVAPHDNLAFNAPKSFAAKLEPKTDIGAVCISADGNTLYYTRWYVRKGKQQMEIAIAEKQKGEWVSKESLAFCSRKYSCCYPFLSPDGKTMYFSSDMEGGYGGMDLYASQQDGGKWTTPKNLGNSINTAQNEIYPRILSDNQLWFSSDGRAGYGKLDLFFTVKNEDGSWDPVVNPGAPYNSPFSDYSILDIPGYDTRLFVSDREDGGLRDRIYKVKKEFRESVQILVRDKQSNEYIKDVNVTVRKAPANTEINLGNNGNGVVFFEILKSESDKGIWYEIEIKKSGYSDRVIEYYPSGQKKNVEVILDRIVEPNQFSFVPELLPIEYPDKKITFQNIYFEKNEDDFSADAKRILDRLYRFWAEFPELGIKINGHSDSKGLVQMNKDVSLLKAEKAKEYLVGRGVKSSVIEVGAWGEEFILNGCFDDSECSEKEHQENRRLELIFVL